MITSIRQRGAGSGRGEVTPELVDSSAALHELLRGHKIYINEGGILAKEIRGTTREDAQAWIKQKDTNVIAETRCHNTSAVLRDTDADYVIDSMILYPPSGRVDEEILPGEQLRRVIAAAKTLIGVGVPPTVKCGTPFCSYVGSPDGYEFIVDQDGRPWSSSPYTLGDVAKWTVKPEDTGRIPPVRRLP